MEGGHFYEHEKPVRIEKDSNGRIEQRDKTTIALGSANMKTNSVQVPSLVFDPVRTSMYALDANSFNYLLIQATTFMNLPEMGADRPYSQYCQQPGLRELPQSGQML